jgi:hypothetical protein
VVLEQLQESWVKKKKIIPKINIFFFEICFSVGKWVSETVDF